MARKTKRAGKKRKHVCGYYNKKVSGGHYDKHALQKSLFRAAVRRVMITDK